MTDADRMEMARVDLDALVHIAEALAAADPAIRGRVAEAGSLWVRLLGGLRETLASSTLDRGATA